MTLDELEAAALAADASTDPATPEAGIRVYYTRMKEPRHECLVATIDSPQWAKHFKATIPARILELIRAIRAADAMRGELNFVTRPRLGEKIEVFDKARSAVDA